MTSSSNNINIDNLINRNGNSTVFSILLNYEFLDSDDEPEINPFNSRFIRESVDFFMDTIGSELETVEENMDNQDVLRRVSSTINNRVEDRFQSYFNRSLNSIRFQIEYRANLGSINFQVDSNLRNSENSIILKEKYNNIVDKLNGTQKFLKDTNQDDDKPICAVCLENLKLYRVWHKPKSCIHIFHPKCLRKHYKFSNKEIVDCPVCRKDMTV